MSKFFKKKSKNKPQDSQNQKLDEAYSAKNAFDSAGAQGAGSAGSHTHESSSPAQGAGSAQTPVQASVQTPTPGFIKAEDELPYNKPKTKSSRRAKISGIVVLLALVLIGLTYWFFRPVEVNLNGQRVTIGIRTSAADLIAKKGIKETPGNLISVSGKLLKKAQGTPYTLQINGQALSMADARAYQIVGGETIKVSAGTDLVEPYTVEVKKLEPKLIFDGKAGAVAWVKQWGKIGEQQFKVGKISGETVPSTVLQKVQDVVVKVQNLRPTDDNKKLVALTFGDGPSVYTERILKILKEKNVHATFFNLGQNAKTRPDLTQACLAAGNQVLSHTYSDKVLPDLSASALQDELTQGFSALNQAAGVKTNALRPPYGPMSAETWLKTKGLVSMSIIWNVDSQDWRRPGPDVIFHNVTSNLNSGDIILMQDGGGPREQDVQALPGIIDEIKKQGFTFVTIEELAKSAGLPAEVASGNNPMPKDAAWPSQIGAAPQKQKQQ